jgi:hypothetical protein
MANEAGTGEIVDVALPNGARLLARVQEVDGGGATKVGWRDRLDFDEVAGAVSGVAEAIQSAMETAAPDKVSVTVGLELAVKSGKLVALVVEGDAKASLSVTMEWDRGPAAPDG